MITPKLQQHLHNLAGEVERLERRLRRNVSLGKHAAYVKAEFVEIEDAMTKLALRLHELGEGSEE